MSTLLNNPYLVKVSTNGGGGQKYPKICSRGSWMVTTKIMNVKHLGLLSKMGVISILYSNDFKIVL